jgi:heme exporter protein A
MDNRTPTPPAVEVRSLTKSFGNIKVLRSLDLKVTKGTTLAIFGPNGAGKTTLIKTLASVMRPTSGTILIDGLDVKEHPEDIRAKIGLLAHQSYLYGALSAEENLAFYGKMYGVTGLKGRIDDIMSTVGLAARRHYRVGTFSRGMLQRLSLARALLHSPTLLLLDEPDTGLDPQGLAAMWQIIRKNAPDRTVIFTSHNFERALAVCDEVAVLTQGKIAFTGRSCELTLASIEQAYNNCVGVKL